MKRLLRKLEFFLFCMILCCSFCLGQNTSQSLALTTVEPDGSISWYLQNFSSDTTSALGKFGRSGEALNYGYWKSSTHRSRVRLIQDSLNQIKLVEEATVVPVDLGQFGSKVFALLGFDWDGNKLADAALLASHGRRWVWRFRFNPFSGLTPLARSRMTFGASRSTPFVMKLRGGRIAPAVLIRRSKRVGRIQFKPLGRRKHRSVRLKGLGSTKIVEILPLMNRGTRQIGLVTSSQQGQKISIFDGRGRQITNIAIPAGFSVFVTDFELDGMDEIAFAGQQEVLLSSGRSIQLVVEGAVPMQAGLQTQLTTSDELYTQPDVSAASPTPIITLAPTAEPSNTPTPLPTVTHSVTPTPIFTATIAPTYTPFPTYTPLPTLTPVPTQTPTNTPTLTPTGTSTPTVTPTGTPTPTSTPTVTPIPNESFMEVGTVSSISNTPVTVPLLRTYADPVVILGTASYEDSTLSQLQIVSTSSNNFVVVARESLIADGTTNALTNVPYMVVERGSWVISNGVRVVAGVTRMSPGAAQLSINFPVELSNSPVMFADVQNEEIRQVLTPRTLGISSSGFDLRLSSEANIGRFGEQSVGWVAIESASGTFANRQFQAGIFSQPAGTSPITQSFATPMSNVPLLFTAVSSNNESEAVAIKQSSLSNTGVQTRLVESNIDGESSHADESLSYLVVDGVSGIVEGYREASASTLSPVSFGYEINISDFSSAPVTLNGHAQISGQNARLTPDQSHRAGSMFFNSTQSIGQQDAVYIRWTTQISSTGGAGDGSGVVLHRDTDGQSALGGTGSGFGYSGITPSVALIIKEFGSDALRLYRNGSLISETATAAQLDDGGENTVHIYFLGQSNHVVAFVGRGTEIAPGARAFLNSTTNIFDLLGGPAYIGVTAGCGHSRAAHDTLGLKFIKAQ